MEAADQIHPHLLQGNLGIPANQDIPIKVYRAIEDSHSVPNIYLYYANNVGRVQPRPQTPTPSKPPTGLAYAGGALAGGAVAGGALAGAAAGATDPSKKYSSNPTYSKGNTITDEDLEKLSEALFIKDNNNANKHITVNLQKETTSSSTTDDASQP